MTLTIMTQAMAMAMAMVVLHISARRGVTRLYLCAGLSGDGAVMMIITSPISTFAAVMTASFSFSFFFLFHALFLQPLFGLK
jgi:hypothetical protein